MTNTRKPTINWPIVILGVLWWYLETKFFGWNQSPGSVAELFADGAALAFFAAAFWRPPAVYIINRYAVGEQPNG